MAGVKALRKIQIGRESTAGTAVPATEIWRGEGAGEGQRTVVFPVEDVGYLSGVNRSYTPRVYGALDMSATPATFEQLPHILEAGVKTVTATADGSGYVYTYPLPTTAANTIKTYTLEAGDNQQAEEMEYSFVESFTLEGRVGEAWNMSAAWRGRQWATTTYTGALSLVPVEEMLFSKTKLYIDDATAAFGSTLKSDTLLSASLAVTTGLMPVFTANGELYFSFTKTVMPEVVLTITFEHDGTSVAEKALWRSETARNIRLICEGSALGTPGATYSKKTTLIDLSGTWESFAALADENGNDTVTATFRARYDTTAAHFATIVVVNEDSSL